MAFTPGTPAPPARLVADPELSPLDLAIAPNGNIVDSSEHPFGALDAVTSVREYDPTDGHLVRVFSPNGKAEFRKPRGLRFAPNGVLYCVARDEVVGFDAIAPIKWTSFGVFPLLNGLRRISDVKPHDVVLVRPGARVPADDALCSVRQQRGQRVENGAVLTAVSSMVSLPKSSPHESTCTKISPICRMCF